MHDAAVVYQTDIPNLSQVPLEQLLATDDSALGRAYRRISAELSSAQEAVAGYVSVVDGESQPG